MSEKINRQPLANVPGYEITDDGHVFSVSSNWRGYGEREMTQHLNGHGYPSVRLTVNGHRKRYLVHTLVANTFISAIPDDCDQLRHLDGNRTNNHYTNLVWGTAQDNANDRERHGHTSRGHKHSQAIINGLRKG